MRKLIVASIFALALAAVSSAQSTSSQADAPNMGRAPSGMNGIGRLDARVLDADGNPVPGVSLKLESERTDGFYCESWNTSDAHGVAVLPPLHMGHLRLIVKAKGYEDQKLDVDPSTLGEPYRVTLKKK
jgi:hypothetical protein